MVFWLDHRLTEWSNFAVSTAVGSPLRNKIPRLRGQIDSPADNGVKQFILDGASKWIY